MAARNLALANTARIRHAGIDADEMFSFVTKLAPINALAERAPGFVWRLADLNGATGVEVFPEDPNVIINLSVWESLEAAFDFTYKTVHAKVMSRRSEWFVPVEGVSNLALWWIGEGHKPSVAEAIEAMRLVRANGPSPKAFTFETPFNAAGAPAVPAVPRKDCA